MHETLSPLDLPKNLVDVVKTILLICGAWIALAIPTSLLIAKLLKKISSQYPPAG